MDERIRSLRSFFVEQKAHHALRQPRQSQTALAEEFEKEHTPALQRAVRRAQYILQREIPVVFPEERIALMRTVPETPLLYTQQEYDALRAEYWIHESGADSRTLALSLASPTPMLITTLSSFGTSIMFLYPNFLIIASTISF